MRAAKILFGVSVLVSWSLLTALFIVGFANAGSNADAAASFSASPVSAAGSSSGISASELARHGSQADCWLTIGGKVYDVTGYLPNHPGGPGTIIPYCGKDATAVFAGLPHSQTAQDLLASYYVGELGQNGPPQYKQPNVSGNGSPVSLAPFNDTPLSPKPQPPSSFSPAQVGLHGSQGDCWLIVGGNVYDVTSYVPYHPGGPATIVPYCGKDATAAFAGLPHSQTAASLLASYYKGVLVSTQPSVPALSVYSSTSTVTAGTAASVVFTVTSAGVPVGGALVGLGGVASGSGTTAADGTVSLSINAVSAGAVTATASKAGYTNGITTLTAAATPPANPSTFTLADVASHNSQGSCWMIVSGSVYDVTSYLPFHPGGVAAILPYCGGDGSAAFTGLPHSQNAGNLLASYLIGVVSNPPPQPIPALSVSAVPASVTVGASTPVTFSVTSSGAPVGGVLVSLGGVASGSGTTAANGVVSISVNAASAGTITATASKVNYTSGVVVLAAVSPAPPVANSTPAYSLAQVALHNSQGSCWMVVGGNVYDVTSYLPFHPGGVAAILPYCGADGTAAFTGLPHSQNAAALLASYFIGVVGAAQPPALSVSAAPASVVVGNLTPVSFTVTSAGVPVGGALVGLGGVASGSGTTDANGVVVLGVNATAAGTVTVSVSKVNYASGTAALSAASSSGPAVPSLSVSASPSEVRVGSRTSVTFTVTSAGSPVGGVLVSLSGAASGSGVTDASGKVELVVNPAVAGSVTVTATKAGYISGTASMVAVSQIQDDD